MSTGSLFQAIGAITENALSDYTSLVHEMSSSKYKTIHHSLMSLFVSKPASLTSSGVLKSDQKLNSSTEIGLRSAECELSFGRPIKKSLNSIDSPSRDALTTGATVLSTRSTLTYNIRP